MQAHLIKWIQISSDAVKPLEEETIPPVPADRGNDTEMEELNSQGQSEETQAIEESLRDLNLNRPGPDLELLPEGLLPCDLGPTTNGVGMDFHWQDISGMAKECSRYNGAMELPSVARMASTGCEEHGLQNSTSTVHRCSQYYGEAAKSRATDNLNVRELECSQYSEVAAARMSSTGSSLQTSAHTVRECSQYGEAAVCSTAMARECSQYNEVVHASTTTETQLLELRKHFANVARVSSTGFEGRGLPGCSQYDEATYAPGATSLRNRVVARSAIELSPAAQSSRRPQHNRVVARSATEKSSTGFEGCATALIPSVEERLPQAEREMSSTGFEGSKNTFVDHRDLPALRRAKAKLVLKLRDKTLSLFFRGRLTGMVALINLYLDHQLGLKWIAASKIAAKAAGKGEWLARNLRRWVILFMNFGVYPVRKRRNNGIPSSEDLDQLIHLHLLELNKAGHVRAQDIVDFLDTPAMRAHLGTDKTFKIRAAQRWMERMGWRYGAPKNGMYKDGHEDPEVIAYRRAFCERWTNDYSPRMRTYDNNGCKDSDPKTVDLQSGRYPLILVTHDESTFYANDRRKTRWHHPDAITPQPKGEGQSIMVSDFLTPEWGRLKHGDE